MSIIIIEIWKTTIKQGISEELPSGGYIPQKQGNIISSNTFRFASSLQGFLFKLSIFDPPYFPLNSLGELSLLNALIV